MFTWKDCIVSVVYLELQIFFSKYTTRIVGFTIPSMITFPLPCTFEVSLATTIGNDGAEEFSAAITDVRNQFEDELTTQGKMLVDDMGNAFNIESVQSPVNLA